jgi:DnaJ-class molecular chaperone
MFRQPARFSAKTIRPSFNSQFGRAQVPARLFSHDMRQQYYDILRIRKDASQKEIKAAFYRMAKIHHLDVQGGNHKEFVKIQHAYRFLSGLEHTHFEEKQDQHQATQNEERYHEYARRPRREAEEKINQMLHEAVWSGLRAPLFLLGIIIILAVMDNTYETYHENKQRRLREERQRERQLKRELELEELRKLNEAFNRENPNVDWDTPQMRRHRMGMAI